MSGPDDLTRLVKAGRITAADAKVIRKHRRRAAVLAEARAEREAQQAKEHEAWLARRAETDRMAPTWAQFILAHSRPHADLVVNGYPIREAVANVEKLTGCKVGCAHRPLTAEQREQLLGALVGIAEASGETRAEAAQKAELILDYAPTLVLPVEPASAL
jgi:hypothetical protein